MATHHTNPAKSDRLQKTIAVLADGQWHSTFEIAQRTQSVAVHSDLHDLKKAKYTITRKYCGKNENGRQINMYRWEPGQKVSL